MLPSLMAHDPHQIEASLARLIGLPLWTTRRAADMQEFHFGAQRTGVAHYGKRKGSQVTYGQIALHVQCAWRVCGSAGLQIASGDLRQKSTAAKDVADDEWDWDVSGANRRDELLNAWLSMNTYTVNASTIDAYGGFTLLLERGYELRVFPDVSSDSECWRLLFNDEDRDHLVVLGNGIEV